MSCEEFDVSGLPPDIVSDLSNPLSDLPRYSSSQGDGNRHFLAQTNTLLDSDSPSDLSPSNDTREVVSELETRLREDSETNRYMRRRKEPVQASVEAAIDRQDLPFLTPIDLAEYSTTPVTLDYALNIFLFVNPTSGGNAAATFMEGGLEHIRMTVGQPVNLWIWDIRQGATGNKPGFIKLKRIVDALILHSSDSSSTPSSLHQRQVQERHHFRAKADQFAYVIVAGGDGTVMWCLTELWVHGINDDRVAIGVVPYGTGNDFARALGWNKFNAVRPYDNKFKLLKVLVVEWLNAKIVYHDIWEVVMQIYPDGTFQNIDPATRRKKTVTGVLPVVDHKILPKTISLMESSGERLVNLERRVLRLNMSNYFSCGIESRIGIGFDRHRTRSQMRNRLRYFIEGIKKASCRSTASLNEMSDTFQEDCENGSRRTLFSTDTSRSDLQLAPSTMSFVASNIPSFAAGLDLWTPARALGVHSRTPGDAKLTEILTHKQKLGDGMLEFLSLGGPLAWALERAFHGQGKRLTMGHGPFELKFKDLSFSTFRRPVEPRFYCQIDGEFYILTKPDSIRITHKRRIKVLASPRLDAPYIISAVEE